MIENKEGNNDTQEGEIDDLDIDADDTALENEEIESGKLENHNGN